LIKFPLGLLAAYFVAKYLHDSPHKKINDTVDWVGIGLLAVGLVCMQYVLEEGQRYDWFDDPIIVKASIISFITLVFFVYWELRRKNTSPVVDLRVMKERSLAVGVLLNMLLGFALFSATYLFPVFVQGILGFTPTESGLALVPGGIVMGIAVLAGGKFMQLGVQPRNLVIFGIPIACASMWFLGHLTSLSGFDDAQFGMILRGFGLGFVSTPITIAAFAGLRGRQIASGSALLNLCRQLGGSFGIAILGSYVASQTQIHRSILVANIFSGSQPLRERIGMQAAVLSTRGIGSHTANAVAFALVNHSIQRQATTMAYNDAYLLVAMVLALLFPAVFLFKKSER